MPVSQINSNSLATGVPSSANMPAGSVLQVVSTTKTDTFTSGTTGAFTDITGMSVSITPRFSTSKILVTVSGTCSGQSVTSGSLLRLLRGSTPIDVGDASGSRSQATTNCYQADGGQSVPFSMNFLDSPATTSATTYKIQFRVGSGTFYFNRVQSDDDNGGIGRFASTITVMEIAA
jgi:hypothetical protein